MSEAAAATSPAEREPDTPGSGGVHGRFLLLSLAVLVLDQWTKWLVEVHLPPHTVEPVIPGLFNLSHVRNTGVAFGMFSSGTSKGSPLLLVVGVLALSAILFYYRALPASHKRALTALALVLGGAVGNLLDRLFAGAVTDFLDVYYGSHHWPAFNVADSAICIGIGLLLLDSVLTWRTEQKVARQKAARQKAVPE